jgi:hypothetical protein
MVVVLDTECFSATPWKSCVRLEGAGIMLTLSPAAAIKLADSLIDASAMALGQVALKLCCMN